MDWILQMYNQFGLVFLVVGILLIWFVIRKVKSFIFGILSIVFTVIGLIRAWGMLKGFF
ncbi:hypothetical protein [Pueribacillus sp. YX66]|uniref:hypothetical protein n=1 Tax=Pueribacillus sp. YX66 TaxID=3229242 RepID=UPI00358CF5C9